MLAKITLPYQVAKMISLNQLHPVTAWRNYFKISKNELAKNSNLTVFEVEQIEKSNLHLKKEISIKLANAFNVSTEAIAIRYMHKTLNIL